MQTPGTTEAMEAMEATDRLLAGWAHDLGKPLQVIWAHGRQLADLAGVDPQMRAKALAIVALSRDALGVIDRLTDPAALAAPRRAARISCSGDLAGLLARAAEIAGRLKPGRDIRILEPIPRAEIDGRNGLVPALVNLVDNAVQASSADRSVTIRAHELRLELVIEVLDRGTGMSDYVLAHAFDPYFSTRRHPRAGSRGLGLANARARVEALGGRIELESTVGLGTRAKIRLPLPGTAREPW